MKIVNTLSIATLVGFSQWASAHPGHDAPLLHDHLGGASSGWLLAGLVLAAALAVVAPRLRRRSGTAKHQEGAAS